MSSLIDRAASAIAAGERFLADRQMPDGLWRDYQLEPGESEAWITACVGLTLAGPPADQQYVRSLSAAADGLRRLHRPTGWGYNRYTATDADSTAWSWRFLAAIGQAGDTAEAELAGYLTSQGHAVTFRDRRVFGSWACEHADVTPVVGMALLTACPDSGLIRVVREAVLGARRPGGLWASFWWTTDSYAVSRNLELLAATGGIPTDVVACARDWHDRHPPGITAFEAAQLLSIDVSLSGDGVRRCESLLAWQHTDGGWPPSPTLLVPGQFRDSDLSTLGNPDINRLMSTLMGVHALKQWLQGRRPG